MTIGELRELIRRIDLSHDGREVKVWMPGTRIRLTGKSVMVDPRAPDRVMLIEGEQE